MEFMGYGSIIVDQVPPHVMSELQNNREILG